MRFFQEDLPNFVKIYVTVSDTKHAKKSGFYETFTLYALSMFNYKIRTLILDNSGH